MTESCNVIVQLCVADFCCKKTFSLTEVYAWTLKNEEFNYEVQKIYRKLFSPEYPFEVIRVTSDNAITGRGQIIRWEPRNGTFLVALRTKQGAKYVQVPSHELVAPREIQQKNDTSSNPSYSHKYFEVFKGVCIHFEIHRSDVESRLAATHCDFWNEAAILRGNDRLKAVPFEKVGQHVGGDSGIGDPQEMPTDGTTNSSSKVNSALSTPSPGCQMKTEPKKIAQSQQLLDKCKNLLIDSEADWSASRSSTNGEGSNSKCNYLPKGAPEPSGENKEHPSKKKNKTKTTAPPRKGQNDPSISSTNEANDCEDVMINRPAPHIASKGGADSSGSDSPATKIASQINVVAEGSKEELEPSYKETNEKSRNGSKTKPPSSQKHSKKHSSTPATEGLTHTQSSSGCSSLPDLTSSKKPRDNFSSNRVTKIADCTKGEPPSASCTEPCPDGSTIIRSGNATDNQSKPKETVCNKEVEMPNSSSKQNQDVDEYLAEVEWLELSTDSSDDKSAKTKCTGTKKGIEGEDSKSTEKEQYINTQDDDTSLSFEETEQPRHTWDKTKKNKWNKHHQGAPRQFAKGKHNQGWRRGKKDHQYTQERPHDWNTQRSRQHPDGCKCPTCQFEQVHTTQLQAEAAHRDLLGVPATAGTAQIRKAYLKLALKLHPDKRHCQNASERKQAQEEFHKLQAAYKALTGGNDCQG